MKIAILGSNFYPELIGISVYTTEMSEHLRKARHEVTVFTAFPYYPQWDIPQQYKGKLFATEEHNGVLIRRSYIYVPKQVTTISRIIHELSFIVSSCINILFSKKPDFLIIVSPPLALGLVGCIVNILRRIPFIFHIQDLQPDAAVELGMVKNWGLIRILYKMEKFIYANANKISTISNKMGEKVIAKGVHNARIILFPNWVDTEYFKPFPKQNVFRIEHGLKDKFIVLYSGNIGYKQGMDIILKTAKEASDIKDIIFVIVGDGAYKTEFFRKYKQLNLHNVLFLPLQPKEMLPYMLSAADVSLVLQKKQMTDIVMPSKLLGIMACGSPVIVGANLGSNLHGIISESGCGIIIKPEDSVQLLDAMMEIYHNPHKAEEFGRKGRDFAVKHYSKEEILCAFEKRVVHEKIKQ